MKFQVPATPTKVTTMGDNSLRIQIDVDRELSPEENAQVFSLYNKSGWFLFKETEVEEEDLLDIPDEKLEFKDQKTSSQILRNRLFVYYKKFYGKEEGFEDWRKKEMLKIGQHYLNKIQD
jgi:hypothetical protein